MPTSRSAKPPQSCDTRCDESGVSKHSKMTTRGALGSRRRSASTPLRWNSPYSAMYAVHRGSQSDMGASSLRRMAAYACCSGPALGEYAADSDDVGDSDADPDTDAVLEGVWLGSARVGLPLGDAAGVPVLLGAAAADGGGGGLVLVSLPVGGTRDGGGLWLAVGVASGVGATGSGDGGAGSRVDDGVSATSAATAPLAGWRSPSSAASGGALSPSPPSAAPTSPSSSSACRRAAAAAPPAPILLPAAPLSLPPPVRSACESCAMYAGDAPPSRKYCLMLRLSLKNSPAPSSSTAATAVRDRRCRPDGAMDCG